jgi:hypothetical protein
VTNDRPTFLQMINLQGNKSRNYITYWIEFWFKHIVLPSSIALLQKEYVNINKYIVKLNINMVWELSNSYYILDAWKYEIGKDNISL